MSFYEGQILVGQYVDLSLRYYVVTKVTPKKVKMQRLKVRYDKDGNEYPGSTRYGDIKIATKKGDCLYWTGEVIVPYPTQ
jgi:hypothetical protein